MPLIVQVFVVLAASILALLLYLLLFERGPFYRTSAPVWDVDDAERMRRLSSLVTTPLQAIHSLDLVREGPPLYVPMLEAIRGAKRSVHLEVYIFKPGTSADHFLRALLERARAGVSVRVIIDSIGSLGTPQSLFDALRAAGGAVHRYHPLSWRMLMRWNSRTHRNLLVVDGEIAFIGGAGVADHWTREDPAPWRDCIARVTGPIVAGLQGVFAENWLECAGELLVGVDAFPATGRAPTHDLSSGVAVGLAVGSTPTAGRSTKARMLVQFLLASASESIDLCSPYFIPDFGIRRELAAARARGVRVRVLTGGPYTDHGLVRRAGRRRYGQLLKSGVAIHEFSSHMMHAKVLIIDARFVLLGSTNIDNRSFGLNDEVNLLALSPAAAARLHADFEGDLTSSRQLDLHAWRSRPWVERILAALGRFLERHQ